MSETTIQPLSKTSWKRVVLTSLLCVTATVVLAGGLFTWWLLTPPPMPRTTDEAAGLLRSLRFHWLSPERKLDYGYHIRDLLVAANEQERQAFFDRIGDREALRKAVEDMQREALVRRAREYALADEAGRRVLIGQMFMEFMQMRGVLRGVRLPEAGPRTPEERQAEREQRRAEFVGEIESSAATGNPQDMQLIGEMFAGIQKQVGGMLGGGRRPRPAPPPSQPSP